MKQNWNVEIRGNVVVDLVPYHMHHVERYHTWLVRPHALLLMMMMNKKKMVKMKKKNVCVG